MIPGRTQNDLRCFCLEKPLLATYGVDEKGELYIHIKVYKQRRIYGEVVIKGGTSRIHCRACDRWHTIVIREGSAALRPSGRPEELPKGSV